MNVTETPETSSAQKEDTSIVFCHCAYTKILPQKVKDGVLAGLKQNNVQFEEVEDLCRMSAEKDPRLKELADKKSLKIAACYPRAVKWLFHAAENPLDEEKHEVLNMREDSAEAVCEAIVGEPISLPEETPEVVAEKSQPWKPWFPVIDFDRCTNCMQCLSFCLFDVYGVSEDKKIQVQNPTKCKTDCPACSRVCPEAAILFPKYRAAPINGAPVDQADLEREKMKVDISSLLGGDIYSLLRDRSTRARSRFSKERDEERALKERKRCLKKLQETLDIPQALMDELPSAQQIQNKFEKAAGEPSAEG